MKQIYSYVTVLLAIAVLTLGLTGSASAGTLKSAPFYACGTDVVSCTGINVSPVARAYLTVMIVDDSGLVAINTCKDVAPGATCSTSVEAPKGGFCGLVFDGSAKHVRGSISIVDSTGNTKAALPAE